MGADPGFQAVSTNQAKTQPSSRPNLNRFPARPRILHARRRLFARLRRPGAQSGIHPRRFQSRRRAQPRRAFARTHCRRHGAFHAAPGHSNTVRFVSPPQIPAHRRRPHHFDSRFVARDSAADCLLSFSSTRVSAHGELLGRVMHFAVGDHDRARDPAGWHVGQRVLQRGESLGAVILAGRGGGDAGFTHGQVRAARPMLSAAWPARASACAGRLAQPMLCERSMTTPPRRAAAHASPAPEADPARANRRSRTPSPRAQAPRARTQKA